MFYEKGNLLCATAHMLDLSVLCDDIGKFKINPLKHNKVSAFCFKTNNAYKYYAYYNVHVSVPLYYRITQVYIV